MKQIYFFYSLLLFLCTISYSQNNALQIGNENFFACNYRITTTNDNHIYHLDSNSFTIEYDFYLNALTNFNGRFSSLANSSLVAKPIHFYVNNLGASSLSLGNGITEETVPGMPSFNQQQWYHIAIVVTNTTPKNVKVYINGIPTVDYNFTVILDGFTGQASMNLGATNFNSTTNVGNSKYDNLRIWSTARSASEIANNFNSCLTGNETGLVSYFNFDKYNGRYIKNLANNSITLNVTNAFSYETGSGCSETPLFAPIAVTGNYSGTFYYSGQINGKPYYKTENIELNCNDNTSQAQCAGTPSFYDIIWINNQWELRYDNCFWELGEACVSAIGTGNNTPLSTNSATTTIPPCTGWSAPGYIFCPTLSVATTELDKKINVYPNPSTGLLNLSLAKEATVEVYDISGKKILSKKVNEGSSIITISNYQSGIYFLKVTDSEGTTTKKVIKN